MAATSRAGTGAGEAVCPPVSIMKIVCGLSGRTFLSEPNCSSISGSSFGLSLAAMDGAGWQVTDRDHLGAHLA
ncbi:hypothetical protein AWZ03_004575 [Drosophila navojoa]|uniref:Uncharacterized protein n=1 Tax=Drosophila navojoa TaxID=7232 RepID=A0A484BM28_DRONA|nr:hypothetical protein AWZ03_004575 [Drosophila navojoa]